MGSGSFEIEGTIHAIFSSLPCYRKHFADVPTLIKAAETG